MTGLPPYLVPEAHDDERSADVGDDAYGVDVKDDGYSIQRRHLRPTGESADRSEFETGSSIRVSVKGELLDVDLRDP